MWKWCENTITRKGNKNNVHNIIIGYYSASINNNLDNESITNSLIQIIKEFKNVKILLVGKYRIPDFLTAFLHK